MLRMGKGGFWREAISPRAGIRGVPAAPSCVNRRRPREEQESNRCSGVMFEMRIRRRGAAEVLERCNCAEAALLCSSADVATVFIILATTADLTMTIEHGMISVHPTSTLQPYTCPQPRPRLRPLA